MENEKKGLRKKRKIFYSMGSYKERGMRKKVHIGFRHRQEERGREREDKVMSECSVVLCCVVDNIRTGGFLGSIHVQHQNKR